MTCRELIEFLDDYVSGQLENEQRRVFDEHLRICTPCVQYLDSYRAAIEMGKHAYDDCDHESLPEDVPATLLEAIRKAQKK